MGTNDLFSEPRKNATAFICSFSYNDFVIVYIKGEVKGKKQCLLNTFKYWRKL